MANASGNKILKPHEVLLAMGVVCMTFGLILFFAGRWEISKEEFVGDAAPEIEFQTNNGKSGSLTQQKGAVVLINFWASWCQPCMEEMPALRMLEDHFKDKGFVMFAFNIGGDHAESFQAKVSSSKMPKNLVFNFSKSQLKPYSVDGIPLSVLINKEGKIHRVYRGPQDWMDISVLREIENLISK